MAFYSIKQVSQITGMEPHVLRYYENEGLLPVVGRSEGGIRQYTEEDLEWLNIIRCLKKTGMPIKQIKAFMEMTKQGDETLKERCEMLQRHREGVEQHLCEMQEHLFMVRRKIQYFQDLYEKHCESQKRITGQLKTIFGDQTKRYPLMMPQDAVKMLYQNEFGGGHIIANSESSLQHLAREYASVRYDASLPPFEDIGNNLCRLNLGALKPNGVSMETVNRVFVNSASQTAGSLPSFTAKIRALRTLAQEGLFSFTDSELDDYLVVYEKEGYPVVSHSRAYRAAYHPAYRVMRKKYRACMDICRRIDGLLREREHIAVAIDGNCGSGKTTLANLLKELYDANIVHMDDFFLPMELRTPERLGEAGGNVHYERFLSEVAKSIQKAERLEYRVFDCKKMDYTDKRTMDPKSITVVEGAYSMHPKFGDLYDLRVFVTCSGEEQDRRIRERNGAGEMYRDFTDKWIPMENRYFSACRIRENCGIVVDSERTSLVE